MQKKKVVIAYNGELFASVAIRSLANAGYDVIAVTIDLGGDQNFTEIRTRAIQVGANSSYLIDAKKEFAEQYALPIIQARAFCENKYPFVSLLSRPLVVQKLVEIAEIEKAFAIVYDQLSENINEKNHFEQLVNTLNPSLQLINSMMGWTREDLFAYAREKNLTVGEELENVKFVNHSSWGREVLSEKSKTVHQDVYKLTVAIEETPNEPEWIEIEFKKGLPISIDKKQMSIHEMFSYLNHLAGKHGIGRINPVDNYVAYQNTQTYYEFPAVVTLLKAHGAIEHQKIPEDIAAFKLSVSQKLIELIEDGLWFSPLRKPLELFVKETQQSLQGTICLKLHKGEAVVVEKNPNYSETNLVEELAFGDLQS